METNKTNAHSARDYPHGAVVAVVLQEEKLLVIKRSQFVKAPGAIGFAGGGVEPGEQPDVAIAREMREELNVEVTVLRHVFTGTTPSGVALYFWQVSIDEGQTIVPNPEEVESFFWLSKDDLRIQENLLSSAIEFLDALEDGEVPLVR